MYTFWWVLQRRKLKMWTCLASKIDCGELSDEEGSRGAGSGDDGEVPGRAVAPHVSHCTSVWACPGCSPHHVGSVTLSTLKRGLTECFTITKSLQSRCPLFKKQYLNELVILRLTGFVFVYMCVYMCTHTQLCVCVCVCVFVYHHKMLSGSIIYNSLWLHGL